MDAQIVFLFWSEEGRTDEAQKATSSFHPDHGVGCEKKEAKSLIQPDPGDCEGTGMARLPDDTLVVRGGLCRAPDFENGSGVTIDATGKLDNVSVNAAAGLSLADLTKPNQQAGYPGIRNNQVGVTTLGTIRAAGGDVVHAPTRGNPHHGVLKGLTPDQAARLFQPTRPNPSRPVP